MAEITITETDQRRSTARILDVREDFEVAEGMIPGALHIPMGQLQARLGEVFVVNALDKHVVRSFRWEGE